MINIEEAVEKFNKLSAPVKAVFGSKKIVGELDDMERKHGVSLSSLLVYVAIGEAIEPISYLTREAEISLEKAKIIAKELDEKIFFPVSSYLNFINPDPNKNSDLDNEKKYALNLFEENLLDLLRNKPSLNNAINFRLFYILSRDISFKKELEKTFYNNQEDLTSSIFVLDGKKSLPTVANWLKDFIKKVGSGMFDNVALTKYLTQSENGKKLNPEERKLVGDLLELYRNLKFFPDSMPSDDGEGWAILPIEKNTDAMPKARTVLGPPKTEKEKMIDELRGMSAQYLPGSLEKKVIDEEIRRLGKNF